MIRPLPDRPVRVFFPCTGLGRQLRGFETFTLDCAAELRDDPRLDITVFSGAPLHGVPAIALPNVARDSRAAKWLGHVVGRDAYFAEQLTFFLSFLPRLASGDPHVVYFADLNLGNLCWHWRRASGARYRLLYYNGGLTTKPFTRTDVVQQLTPAGLDEALARGERAERQVVLPHGVRVPDQLPSRITGADRLRLGLPAGRPVVLSVGMLATSIKRMDYLIREIASLAEPRPYLVILGAESSEAPEVRRLAAELLGADNVMIRSVPNHEISDYYRACDVFALATIREGFGMAFVEALAHGLPIVAHDFAVTRFILGELATLTDLTVPGNGARAIAAALGAELPETGRIARHASARARFGWKALHEPYVEMLQQVAAA